MSSYRYMDAKISNFIHRKLATIGEKRSDSHVFHAAEKPEINYEPLALPGHSK